MRVIGTAGHVDHGKSALVEALSGIHPDRLKEEQAREMTIDLGFAWIELPGGEEVGIIDVPGHRDFIENMLAGVGGIDAALFVIAADEGVMPQTREHLAILDLLDIPGGVIALTKVDLIRDNEWLDLVEEDVLQTVDNTVLEGADIVRVSARTKVGLEALASSLEAVLSRVPARNDLGRPRLPIDRVFTIPGFGTVVTGTLIDGCFEVGDEVEIQPPEVRGRIRGLQSHKKKTDLVLPGSRTAVNIAGVDVDEIARGEVVMFPGQYQPTRRLDVKFRLLPEASLPVCHNDETKLFVGAAEVIGRIRLLGTERLNPGDEGWLQVELRDPIICHRGDHFILRRPSPPETIGGGIILDAHPKRRYKRMHIPTIERLRALAAGDPRDIFQQALQVSGIAPLKAVVSASMLSDEAAEQAIADLFKSDGIIFLGETGATPAKPQSEVLVCSREHWSSLQARIHAILAGYHQSNPLRSGMPREELKSKLNLQTRVFAAVVQYHIKEDGIEERGSTVALPEHQVVYNEAQKSSIDRLLAQFAKAPYSPPSVKESQQMVGEEVYQALIDQGTLIQLSQDVVFTTQGYDALRKDFMQALQENGKMTVAQVRDRYETSRKYVLALLEHFDAVGLTVRDGDYRRLRVSN